jgi:FtsP/CotA-like multicopper oxidase with cupredoxin domain
MSHSSQPPSDPASCSRRTFLSRSFRAGAGLTALGTGLADPRALLAAGLEPFPRPRDGDEAGSAVLPALRREGNRLPMAPELRPLDALLRAAPGMRDLGRGVEAPLLLVNDALPSPLLRVRRGEVFSARMENDIPDPLILHWHGLAAPDDMDGHPRFAVPRGGTYDYRFEVNDRAGTYWYHSHTHHLTGRHTYRGIAGLLIVEDPDEEQGMPPRERELPLILQDRRLGPDGVPVYEPMGPSMMNGFMGPEALANGILDAFTEVEPAVYRARILNGSNARIFRLGRSDERPVVLIANDGGFLERPVSLPWVDVAPAERVELLLDFREAREGERIGLVSLPFEIPGGMMGGMGMGREGMGPPEGRGGGRMGGGRMEGGMMGRMMEEAYQQGRPLDLVEFRVTGRTSDPGSIPGSLPPLPELPDPARAVRERRFDFSSRQMMHRVNGREYALDRVDEEVPFGDTEIWTFVNEANYPHPVHLHATHFRVLERRGGRGRLFPWESGGKDTVLVLPGEEVRVAVRFTVHRGLYLLHCHNLEHEDHGMMQNILVV